MPQDLPYLRNLEVFQNINVWAVPTSHRMIGVTSECIQKSIADLDPRSAMALALTEVLCLRENIRQMVMRDM